MEEHLVKRVGLGSSPEQLSAITILTCVNGYLDILVLTNEGKVQWGKVRLG